MTATSKKSSFLASFFPAAQPADAATARNGFIASLRHAVIDDAGFAVIADGDQAHLAFALKLVPSSRRHDADMDFIAESAVIALPAGSVIQSAVLSSPQVLAKLDAWRDARATDNTTLAGRVTNARYEFMRAAAELGAPNSAAAMPRVRSHFLFVQIPVPAGSTGKEDNDFMRLAVELQQTVKHYLRAAGVRNVVMSQSDIRELWVELLNLQMPLRDRAEFAKQSGGLLADDYLMPGATIGVDGTDTILLTGSQAPVAVAALTVDAPSMHAHLQATESVLGNPLSRDDRIGCPFWAYTTIQVVDQEKARSSIEGKVAQLRRTLPGAQGVTNVMSHLADRLKNAEAFLMQLDRGRKAVRAYSGINLYAPPEEMPRFVENTCHLWRKAGFRISKESHIAGAVFAASLPFQYSASIDRPSAGLRRASMMTSFNAACLMFLLGTPDIDADGAGGPLLLSRQGHLTSLDPWGHERGRESNNFLITGSAGSGKNFLAMEVLVDTLAKGGNAAILDMGRSYHHHVAALGGKAVNFDKSTPVTVNPFSLLKSETDLMDTHAMLQAMLLTLAFGTSSLDEVPRNAWMLTDLAVEAAYRSAGANASLQTVIDWLSTRQEPDAALLVEKLSLFVEGKYEKWFSGQSELPRAEDLVVYEFEGLHNDPAYKAVMSAVLIHLHVEAYRAERSQKKLILVGEADSLFENSICRALEMAMRRARALNVAYGLISRAHPKALAQGWHSTVPLRIVLRAHPDMLDLFIAAGVLRAEAREHAQTLYDEMYVEWHEGGGVYRLLVDDFSYFAFTTQARDIVKIREAQKDGSSFVDAVARCADDAQILRDIGRIARDSND